MTTRYFNKLNLCVAAHAVIAMTCLNARGDNEWTNHYEGPWNIDAPSAMALDPDGSVVVSGICWSEVAGDRYDYVTIKYSDAGLALWTNRYGGPGNDRATAVAVDSAGNVIVTGYSGTPAAIPGPLSIDYITIKYSSEGVPLWTNRYDGPGNIDDLPGALAVDAGNNVVVTGYSPGGVSNTPTTIKYSDTGVPLWTNYGGGGVALALDADGNVFVTGSAMIAYSSAGMPLWTNYGGGTQIALDTHGDIFVSGSSSNNNSEDFKTVAFSNSGTALWTNGYNGPGNGQDVPTGLEVDENGRVVVTGRSWNGSSDDFASIAYSRTGVPLWTNRYNGPANGSDQPTAIAIDRFGNVFVTGFSTGIGSGLDYATIAYSSEGVPIWTNRHNGSQNADDGATDIAVNMAGDVFVTGYSYRFGSGIDWTTIRYSGAPPSPPVLAIAYTATNTVAVSWVSPSTGFVLHQNPSVTTTNWTPVGMVPTDDGVTKTVIVDSPLGNTYYRLIGTGDPPAP